jgi:hypothetical protein
MAVIQYRETLRSDLIAIVLHGSNAQQLTPLYSGQDSRQSLPPWQSWNS